MRPPSYYASIVKSNTSNYGHSAHSSNPSDSYISSRTSSQQLRSSLSSSSSSNYVSRSHLPFVPQSTLVAHCFTGVGSSTRPYGTSSSSSSSYRTSSRATSPISYSSSYTRPRPSSTNRRQAAYSGHSPTTSVGYSSSSSSSNYLSPVSSINITSRTYPRPTQSTTTSSYYKPYRLRERPLLTQISRQLPSRAHNNNTPTQSPLRTTTTTTTTDSTRTTSHSSTSEPDQVIKYERAKLTIPSDEANKATIKDNEMPDESNWSSDITRNISRNKYLIKFREFDKHSRPSVDVEATIQLPPVEVSLRDTSHDCDTIKLDQDRHSPSELRESLTVEHTLHLPTAEFVSACCVNNEKKLEELCNIEDQLNANLKSKGEVKKKERKNVKLKLKPISGSGGGELTAGRRKKSELADPEATTTTTVTDRAQKIAEEPDVSPKSERVETETQEAANQLKEVKRSNEMTNPEVSSLIKVGIPKKEQKPVKVLEKKVMKTSVTKDQKILVKTIEDNKKENKSIGTKPKTDVSPPGEAVPSPGSTTTPVAATPKDDNDSKATIVTKPQTTSKQFVETEPHKTKTKLIKKKKRPKQEDDNGTPIRAIRRRSSAIPKDATPLMNEVQVTPATPEAATDISSIPVSKQPSRIRFREYNINDFNFLTVLGHGGWGFVILAELKEHDTCFAVKCIKKITIVEDDDYDSIMIERKVLTLGNIHPFICKLFCTFETPGYLFFVMEYCAGGDLMFHVQHEGKFTESRCRFYAAEIICAIRFLHNRHIIYRDLKLDNILLDARGHIRLVDFGMCQCRTYREEMLPSNFCGTPEYISPEIIKGVPYNHSVDWWSFGVLLYEMAVGKMPFRGNDENELLWNVCYEQIHYPMFLTKELTGLLKSLLEREPTKRMGMATCKSGDIYDQPFFRSVNWKAVEELRVEPPFVPEVKSNRDVSNFDSDFTESTCELSPVDDSTLARIDQKQFEKFPYTNPDIFIFDPTQQSRNVV